MLLHAPFYLLLSILDLAYQSQQKKTPITVFIEVLLNR
jgi:hypothetical protein